MVTKYYRGYKIKKQLPYNLLEDAQVKRKILSGFKVLNMQELHLIYPSFKITEMEDTLE